MGKRRFFMNYASRDRPWTIFYVLYRMVYTSLVSFPRSRMAKSDLSSESRMMIQWN